MRNAVILYFFLLSFFDVQLSRHIIQYQKQAKELVCRLTPTSPSRCSLLAEPYVFHYLLDRGVCYLILTDARFNRTNAFAFLETIQTKFFAEYSSKIHTVSRPYVFLDFGKVLRNLPWSFSSFQTALFFKHRKLTRTRGRLMLIS